MNKKGWCRFVLLVIVLVVAIFAAWRGWGLYYFDNPKRGEIGDMYGGINALFSGLALAGVIVAIVLQSIELKETRKEVRGQKEQLELQNATLRKQNFESTFFQMLSLHQEIVQELKAKPKDPTFHGRMAFELYWDDLKRIYDNETSGEELTRMRVAATAFLARTGLSVSHYLRDLVGVLNYVGNTSRDDGTIDTRFYINIIRDQLTDRECALLFYLSTDSWVADALRKYVLQYKFLQNLNKNLLYNKVHLQIHPLYQESTSNEAT